MFAVGNPPGLYRAARDSLEEFLRNLFSAKRYSKSPGQISKEAVLNSDSNSYLSPFDFVYFLGRVWEAGIMEIQVLCGPLDIVSCADVIADCVWFWIGPSVYLWPWGFPGISEDKDSACNAGDPASVPGLGRLPWRGEWLPTPAFLPGEFHGQRSLMGSTVHRVTKSQTWLSDWHCHFPSDHS